MDVSRRVKEIPSLSHREILSELGKLLQLVVIPPDPFSLFLGHGPMHVCLHGLVEVQCVLASEERGLFDRHCHDGDDFDANKFRALSLHDELLPNAEPREYVPKQVIGRDVACDLTEVVERLADVDGNEVARHLVFKAVKHILQ
jgi:hypothetical protein